MGLQDLHPLARDPSVFIVLSLLFSYFSTFGLQSALNGAEVKQMSTIVIVLLVLFLLGGGGWGYSRWRG